MLLPIHIAAGGLAIVLGAVALSVKKGGNIHRRSGLLFVYAMLVMGFSASILGFLKSPADANVFTGLMTAYFVGTALTTVRPPSRWTRAINIAALTVAAGLACVAIAGGVKAVSNPGLSPGGVPFRTIGVMSLILATVLLLADEGDVRVGGFLIMGAGARLAAPWRARRRSRKPATRSPSTRTKPPSPCSAWASARARWRPRRSAWWH